MTQTHEFIIECAFRESRGLLLQSPDCPSGWLGTALSTLLYFNFSGSSSRDNRDGQVLLLISISILIQMLTIVLLRFVLNTSSNENKIRMASSCWSYFWLNPWLAWSCIQSPLPSLQYFFIIAAWAIASRGYQMCTYLCLALLIIFHNDVYISAVPSFLAIIFAGEKRAPFTNQNGKKRIIISLLDFGAIRWSVALALFLLLAMLVVIVAVVLSPPSTVQPQDVSSSAVAACKQIYYYFSLQIDDLREIFAPISQVQLKHQQRHTYLPGAGIFWYLDAEIFPAFEAYFSLLVSAQPFLYAAPIFFRFAKSNPVIAVCVLLQLF